MNNTELIEKLAVIMDRLDRIERKIDELNKKNNITSITTPTYPPSTGIWYEKKPLSDIDLIVKCTDDDYKLN